MTNEEMRPSIGKYLDDVKEGLETPSDESRVSAIENGMLNLKSKIRGLNIKVETPEQQQEEVQQEHDKISLADAAVDLYRNNLQEKEEKVETPSTRASRANTKAMIRALSGSQTGGNTGKQSYKAGPNGSGSVGAPVPGNVTVPPLDIMAVEETEESIEDYQARIFESFGLEEGQKCWPGYKKKGTKKMFGKTYNNCVKEEEVVEDVVEDLEEVLLELDDTSWQSIDKAMRKLCQENDMTPKQLHKDFKAKHGMIPDQWIKEQEVTEECGWFPLDEMTRVNKVGQVYDVTFLFRGGTSRFKFFWPEAKRPSKSEMQAAVEKFYPKARLLTYYPSMDQTDNYMVMVPPMTENYEIVPEDNWVEMSEELNDTFSLVCEEVGEPISAPVVDEETGRVTVWVEDHDTGEELEVMWEGNKSGDSSLHDWFSKSKSSDGKPGWVQLGGKFAGKPCARQPGQTSTPKCGSSKMKRNLNKKEEERAFRRKNRQDPNQPQKSGAAKPTNVKTEEYVDEAIFNIKKQTPEEKKAKELKKREKMAAEYERLMKHKNNPYADVARRKVKTEDLTIDELEALIEQLNEDDMKGMTVKSGHKRSVAQGAGLTEKGAAAYRRKNPGSKLGTAVTTPPSKLKPGSKAAGRRKSFCARSRGWTGERGKAARRRWNC